MATGKRVFVSFSREDARYRDLLIGQARHQGTPFVFVDLSSKEAEAEPGYGFVARPVDGGWRHTVAASGADVYASARMTVLWPFCSFRCTRERNLCATGCIARICWSTVRRWPNR